MSYTRATRLILSLMLATSMSLVGCKSSHTKSSNKKAAPAESGLQIAAVDEHLEDIRNKIGPLDADQDLLPILQSDYAVSEVLETAEAMLKNEAFVQDLTAKLSKLTKADLSFAIAEMAELKRQRAAKNEFSKEMQEKYSAVAAFIEKINERNSEQQNNAEFMGLVTGGVLIASIAALRVMPIAKAVHGGLLKTLEKSSNTVRNMRANKIMRNARMPEKFNGKSTYALVQPLKLANTDSLLAAQLGKGSDVFTGLLVQTTGHSRYALRGIQGEGLTSKAGLAELQSRGLTLKETRVQGVMQATYKSDGKDVVIYQVSTKGQRFYVKYTQKAELPAHLQGNQATLNLKKAVENKAKLQARLDARNAGAQNPAELGGFPAVANQARVIGKIKQAIQREELIAAESAISSLKARLPLLKQHADSVEAGLQAELRKAQKSIQMLGGKTLRADVAKTTLAQARATVLRINGEINRSRQAADNARQLLVDLDQSLRGQKFFSGVNNEAKVAAAKAKQAQITEKIIASQLADAEKATALVDSKTIKQVIARSNAFGDWSVAAVQINGVKSMPLSTQQWLAESLGAVSPIGLAFGGLGAGVYLGDRSLTEPMITYTPVDASPLVKDSIEKADEAEAKEAKAEEAGEDKAS